MQMIRYACTTLLVSLTLSCGPAPADWLQFRGSGGTSDAGEMTLPTELSNRDNLAWKAALPARGVSGPIAVGDHIIVTCSGGVDGDRLFVLCFDDSSGALQWKRRFWATGRPYCHPTSANAAPTPCSDGKLIYAFFSSNDLICLDLDGRLRWFRGLTYDFPQAANDVGMSSSPVVVEDQVIVQVENQGDSFTMALDKQDGTTRWKALRPREASWSSPLAVPASVGGQALVFVQSRESLAALAVTTGKPVATFEGRCNIIPSVVTHDGWIIAPLNGLSAIRSTADGSWETVWESSKLAPGSASPIVHDGTLYVMNRAGVLNAVTLATGKPLWQKRVGGTYWSTPVAAGDYLYCFDAEGVARVLDLRSKGEIVQTHEFGEPILGSPAVSGNALYIRSDAHLWKLTSRS